MARRIPVDGYAIDTANAYTLEDLMKKNLLNSKGGAIVTYQNGDTKHVPVQEYHNQPLDVVEVVELNQVPIRKGALSDFRIRKKFLDMELPRVCDFLAGFRFKDARIRPEIELDDNYNWIIIHNFPLSDDYSPDYEDIIIITAEYPDNGPIGIHIRNNSKNKSKMIEKMGGGHALEREQYYQFTSPGYENIFDVPDSTWICFYYENFQWNFFPNDVMRGDNLTKYIKALQANLSGNF